MSYIPRQLAYLGKYLRIHTGRDDQIGQTLIETIVAIFILTTTLTAGLALSIYVLSHSDQTQKEIVATNLAREGIDVIKNMRDTNWLESDARGLASEILQDCTLGAGATVSCYPKAWMGTSAGGALHYDLSYGGAYTAQNYRIEFDNTGNTWTLVANPSSYALYQQSDGSYTHAVSGTSNYARRINISYDTNAPYGSGSLSELIVTSIVGWNGRGCRSVTDDPATSNCSVAVTERFTNWKDY